MGSDLLSSLHTPVAEWPGVCPTPRPWALRRTLHCPVPLLSLGEQEGWGVGSRGRCGGHVLPCGQASVCPAHHLAPRTYSSYECCKSLPPHDTWPGHPRGLFPCLQVTQRLGAHWWLSGTVALLSGADSGEVICTPCEWSVPSEAGSACWSPVAQGFRDTEQGRTPCWGCSGRMCSESG